VPPRSVAGSLRSAQLFSPASPGFERTPSVDSELRGLREHLVPAVAADDVIQLPKVQIPLVVREAAGFRAVCDPAVEFDDDPLLAPERVDAVWTDPHVGLRKGKAEALTEEQEFIFQWGLDFRERG